MNLKRFLLSLTVFALSIASLCAQETPAAKETEIDSPSPDGRFAFLTTHQPDEEPIRTCDLIEQKSGKVLVRVAESDEGMDRLGTRVLWSPDSKRFALCATHNHFGESLSVYFRTGGTFQESKLPDLTDPDIPERLKHDEHEWKWTQIGSKQARRWRQDGTLLVTIESTLQALNSNRFLTSKRTVVLGFARPAAAKILRSTAKVEAHTAPD